MKKLLALFLKLSNKNQHRVLFFLSVVLISSAFLILMHFSEKRKPTITNQNTIVTKKEITSEEIEEMIGRIDLDKSTNISKEDVKAYPRSPKFVTSEHKQK